jgi:hypothetical protein
MPIVIVGLVVVMHIVAVGGVTWLANGRCRDAAWVVFMHRWLLASYIYLLAILVSGKFNPFSLLEIRAFLPFAGGLGLLGHAQMGGSVGFAGLAFALAAGGAALYLLRRHWRAVRTFVAVHLVAFTAGFVASEIAFDLAISRSLQELSGAGTTIAWSRNSVMSVFTGRHTYPKAHASAKIGECHMIWSFWHSQFVPLYGCGATRRDSLTDVASRNADSS